jgi:hypothetical protein
VGARAVLNAVTKKTILSPSWESNPGHPARSLVAIQTELCARACMYVLIVTFLKKRLEDKKHSEVSDTCHLQSLICPSFHHYCHSQVLELRIFVGFVTFMLRFCSVFWR